MLKKIIIVVVVIVAAVLIFATTRPDSFRVERSVSIKAPPEKVYAQLEDFRNWHDWSPWENIDPNLKRTYSGSAKGPGAAYAWEGNDQVGSGRMEITSAAPASKVLIKLDFLKPFESHSTADFTLQPQGGSTNVVWAMYGPSPYIAKLMGLFFSMDKMIGGDFDKGLANLKAVAEKSASAQPSVAQPPAAEPAAQPAAAPQPAGTAAGKQ